MVSACMHKMKCNGIVYINTIPHLYYIKINTPTPAGYLIERIDKNILPAIYLLFRTSRNDRFLATQ